MKFIFALFLALLTINAFAQVSVNRPAHTTVKGSAGPCPVTVGTLTLRAQTPRSSGVSPLLVFFDATETTDSAMTRNTTPFQDVYFAWNFGDSGGSGTGKWAYGSNPGVNSMNTATGGIAAHLYLVPDGNGDTVYTATVTATDGTNTASCTVGVTAFDASGANGFPSTATTCVYNSTLGSGCPSGAKQTSSSDLSKISANISNKRILFKCGDTFTGDNAGVLGTHWSIGAYGGCQNTQTNRPIFNDTSATRNPVVHVGGTANTIAAGDGRIADLDLESNGTAKGLWSDNWSPTAGQRAIDYQVTIYNTLANNCNNCMGYEQGTQWGFINNVMVSNTGMTANIAMYANIAANNPPYTGQPFNTIAYTAIIGNSVTGPGSGSTAGGVETLRLSACQGCAIENNTLTNANNVGGVLKLHEGNTYASCSGNLAGGQCFPNCPAGGYWKESYFATTTCWVGDYVQYVEVSDNAFGGNSGANLVEHCPQNPNDDERIRYVVNERNLYYGATINTGRELGLCAQYSTVRDNVFYLHYLNTTNFVSIGVQIANRGIEPAAQYNEIYNNTCYSQQPYGGQDCISFSAYAGYRAAGINNIAKNNMFYAVGIGSPTACNSSSGAPSGYATVCDIGTGNSVSNNSVAVANNPAFTNGSGLFDLITDFKPAANYSGGTSVPNYYDAVGVPWSPTWDLGAVRH